MAAFIGANGQGPRDFAQHVIRPRRQRLFNHLHAKPDQMGRQIGVNFGRPAFIGIDDDAGSGRATAHGLQPRHVIGRAQLDLQQRAMRVLRRLRLHRRGRVQRQGIGSDRRARRGQTQQVPDAFTCLFRRMIPERAIQRIARGPCRQGVLQIRPAPCKSGNLRRHIVQCLAVAGIRHTFTAPRHPLQRHGHGQNLRRGPRPATDRKDLRQTKHIAFYIDLHHLPSPNIPAGGVGFRQKSGIKSPPARQPTAPPPAGTYRQSAGPSGLRPRPDRPKRPPRTDAAC